MYTPTHGREKERTELRMTYKTRMSNIILREKQTMVSRQSTDRLIMVRPASFCFNEETAASNAFQQSSFADQSNSDRIQQQALKEFDHMVEQLRSHQVHVDVFDDTATPIKPDAIFPNNWFSTHDDGTIVLYPMLTENRRRERRRDLIDKLTTMSRSTSAIIDLSINERRNHFLEGTGSMVLDHIHRIVYAIRSPRTDPSIVERFTRLMNYQQPPVILDSVDDQNRPIYHTNVIMAIGTRFAILCQESIPDPEQRARVLASLQQNDQRTVVCISLEQMKRFAGNMLEIRNVSGEYFLVMSTSAYDSLSDQQRQTIEQTQTKLLHFDVSTIEQCGGGSVRCMIAENFLPL